MKDWRAISSQIEDLDIRANLCKNDFYQATIKNYNGAVVMRKFLCDANVINNSIDLKKNDIGEYKTF